MSYLRVLLTEIITPTTLGAIYQNRTGDSCLASKCFTAKLILHMAGSGGLEPSTTRLTAAGSTIELTAHIVAI